MHFMSSENRLFRMTEAFAATPVTDEQLAARIAGRDAASGDRRAALEAFEELYRRHAGKLLGFLAARMKRSDIEDVNQVVWKRVWEHLPSGFHGGNFRAWLHQIARNQMIDHGRRTHVATLGDAGEDKPGKAARADDELLEQERMIILQRCLDRLETELRTLVQARLSGDSYEEVCVQLNLKPERAHKLFHEAKGQLTNCVDRSL